MASIYARGEMLWIKFKNKHGKHECRSSGYRRGQDALARDLAAEVERQASIEREFSGAVPAEAPRKAKPAAAPMSASVETAALPTPAPAATPIGQVGPPGAPGMLRVRVYAADWLKTRVNHSTYDDDEARIRLHINPLIGDMAIADVRPRHIRDLVLALTEKNGSNQSCRNEKLAPRTVRLVFAMLRVMFKSAVIDEHILASPVVLQKGILPKNVDKDPTWRSTAIFQREELISIISDPRIPQYRRVAYALEGVAGVRHGEMAGLRWSDYDTTAEPLGKLVVSRSGEKKRTKTQQTRQVPVHPTLARILAAWRRDGWWEKYGREPQAGDLIVPTERNKVRKSTNTLHTFKEDLARIGLRSRRAHDLRRTFITLAQIDGARRDILKPLTHPSEQDIVGLYTTFPWPVVCGEVAKLRLVLPGDIEANAPTPANSNDANDVANPEPERASQHHVVADHPAGANAQIVPFPLAAVAGYTPSYNPECSLGFVNASAMIGRSNREGLLVRKP